MPHEESLMTNHGGHELSAPTNDVASDAIVAMDARHAIEILEPLPGELVLDAGCGTGRNLAAMAKAGAHVVGVDFSQAALGVAREVHAGAHLARVDLQAGLPFADGTFDAVLCALVGEHVSNLAAALSELRRVLRTGGRLVFSIPHPRLVREESADHHHAGAAHHSGYFGRGVQEYLDFVMDAGFDSLGFAEYSGDQRLADEVPGAQQCVGLPVLLLIAAST